jgi:hypothetical protein
MPFTPGLAITVNKWGNLKNLPEYVKNQMIEPALQGSPVCEFSQFM